MDFVRRFTMIESDVYFDEDFDKSFHSESIEIEIHKYNIQQSLLDKEDEEIEFSIVGEGETRKVKMHITVSDLESLKSAIDSTLSDVYDWRKSSPVSALNVDIFKKYPRISIRLYNCISKMLHNKPKTLNAIMEHSRDEWAKVDGMGWKSLLELEEILNENGLNLHQVKPFPVRWKKKKA